ncbi:hypothetical protein KCP69_03320 [Salmonella enterica subsp. enterica]|nr:hypothetical protein KCP69_03320 [Salmonella enterica subsp. enterica]
MCAVIATPTSRRARYASTGRSANERKPAIKPGKKAFQRASRAKGPQRGREAEQNIHYAGAGRPIAPAKIAALEHVANDRHGGANFRHP